jgi:hypothetical protein
MDAPRRFPEILDGRDAMAAMREGSVLAAGGGEPADELPAKVLGLDDRVDDEFPGEPDDVDVLLRRR